MESQLPRTHGHHYESSDLSGVDELHHEKPSVLKKVKAKAKKIKNTLTKHGHDHEHEHDHDHSHDDEYEDDEDEEMVEDPEIHGAPIYESEAVRGAARAGSGKPVTGGTNLDSPSMVAPHYDSTKPGGTNLDRPSMGAHHYDSTEATAGVTNLDSPLMGVPHYDSTNPYSSNPATEGTNLDYDSSMGVPHYDSSNPTAGGTNLDKQSMGVPHYDSPFVDPETRPFVQWQADKEHGKHLLKEDKHAPLPCKLVDTRSGEDIYPELPHKGINRRTGRDIHVERENPDQGRGPNAMEGIRGGIRTTGFEVDPQGPNIRAHPSNVQVKTFDPASRVSEEAEGITPVIKSFNKMGISEEKSKTGQGEGLFTGSLDQFAPEPMSHESYDAANLQDTPGDIYDPASKSSTYTEKITLASAAAASAIAGTALSAKNVIASKIEQMREPGEGNKTGSVTGTASDYAHRIAASVTDTLAPVYEKVVGVGSGATSKVSSLGAETSQESGGSAGQDKGVSVKGHWVEKLKPGEEDRALSSMITESFGKSKGEKMEEVTTPSGGRSISQIVSDAVNNREPEASEQHKPMGKVTESEEVAKRLGTGEEGTGLENVGTGAGVVNKLTGAIGSWLGGQGGRAKSTPGTTLADDNEGDMKKKNGESQGVAGQRRLQESSN